MDARYDAAKAKHTYWFGYSHGVPANNRGWQNSTVDNVLVLKCNFTDKQSTPQTDTYFEDLFSKKGEGKWGMHKYIFEESYGIALPSTVIPKGWRTIPFNHEWGKGNGHILEMSGTISGGFNSRYYEFELESLGNEEYYIKRGNKYISSSASNNGDKFWTWGPIPAGHEKYYTFKREARGGNKYFFKHKHSEKYLCSGENKEGGHFWMWDPIPRGHESRYTFILEKIEDNKYNIKHESSNKYLRIPFHNRYFSAEQCIKKWGIPAGNKKSIVTIFNVGGIDYGAAGNRTILHMDDFHQNVTAHEMMHNYGLIHSYDDMDREYFDPYDVEGSTPTHTRFTGEFGSSGPGLHAFNKEKNGWMPSDRIKRLPTSYRGTTTVQLAALNRPECNGFMSLIIELPNNEKLAVELRENRGWGQNFGTTAAYVRHIKKVGDDLISYLYSNGDTDLKAGPQLINGESYTGNNFTIKVVEIDAANGTAKLEVIR